MHRVRYSVEATRVGKFTNYDRLVLEIMERDRIAPGYAKAVMAGIAARLEVSDFPDMPAEFKRETTIAPAARA